MPAPTIALLVGREPELRYSLHRGYVDRQRDVAELAATRAALGAGLPILGICRGIQLLAVASGGALHQDLTASGFTGHHWEEDRQNETVHVVEVDAGSITASIVPADRRVNSIHHQGVKAVGVDLAVTARSEDGVVEAVEGDRVLGVQWHPERLFTSDPRHLAPFTWFLEQAA